MSVKLFFVHKMDSQLQPGDFVSLTPVPNVDDSRCATAASPCSPAHKAFLYLITVIAAVGGFLLTYDIIIMSGAILFLKQHFQLTPTQVGFSMTSAIIACFFSPTLGGWLADKFGRKKTLIAAAAIFAVSALGTALSESIIEFNAFRILGGCGVGAACIVSPMYIAEIAPASIRGRLVLITRVVQCGWCADLLCRHLWAVFLR